MDIVNVLVAVEIDDECRRQIAGVSQQVRLTDVYQLCSAEQEGDANAKQKLDALLAEAEVIFGGRLPQGYLSRAPKLRWVQVTSAGVNRFLDAEMLASPVVLTNASGIHATPIGEFVLALMLMFAKRAPLCFQWKQVKKWEDFDPTVLRSKTVGIVGLGHIGREVARLAKAFGMRVLATRRAARKAGKARYVDLLLPAEQLNRLLGESDYVVDALPLTAETDGLIGEAELRAMKPTAYIMNIGRGGTIDEEALVRALEEGWIAGAGLDVFSTEPLPANSKLWDLPNVIYSPHISGGMENYMGQAAEIFTENLRCYLEGRRMVNVVDKKRGY
jgi:phosphoglycerate dehydrogenase-like enzyme